MSSVGRLHHSFRNLVKNLDSAALADQKAQILFMKNPHPFDAGTWGDAFKMAVKYFAMNTGDIFIFNDPFCGGNDFSVLSFITCLQKPHENKPGIFLGHRKELSLPLKDILQPQKNIFRVPMTPVVLGGDIQEAFIEAMAASPLAPPHLKETILAELHKAISVVKYFEIFPKDLLQTKAIQSYLAETRQQALESIHEKPWGETKVEMPLDSGENIKIHIDISESGFKFDFSGTTVGKDFFLPPAALAGICTYWMAQYVDLKEYFNEGLFSLFQVSQPTQSCLAAKSPQLTTRAYKTGARILATAFDMALSHLDLRPPRGITNHFGMYLQIQFPNKDPFEIYLPNGIGALGDGEGAVGFDRFGENPYLSAENTENRWPLRIHRMDIRNTTHGKGKVSGGRGLIYKIELLADAKVYWLTDLTHYRFPVQKFQTSPDRVEIIFGEDTVMNPFGEKDVRSGEMLTVGSGSGGGLI